MINRIIKSKIAESKKSILLLGPRQTGKSTLLRTLKPDLIIDLSDQDEYIEYQADSGLLRRLVDAKKPKVVLIDEIQRIPELTNTIQSIVDKNKNSKFLLSGSSARKLRRGNANLLPGRLLIFNLGPLTIKELNYDVNDTEALAFGFLPEVYLEKKVAVKEKLLRSYSSTYLKEEIQAEALVRSLSGFVRFIQAAAETSGQFLDLSKMSNRAKIPRQSAVRHFEILEDTMIAYRVSSDPDAGDIDLVKHPKYYFFDTGVLNGLLGNFIVSPDRAGLLFEHLFASQIISSCHAKDIDPKLYSFRTRGGMEVDFILRIAKRTVAIELKSSRSISSSDLTSLKHLAKIYPRKIDRFLAYRGTKEQKEEGIWILPWTKVIKELGF